MDVSKAVIPVAGLATRFLPVSKTLPKEILPIGEFPVIHWVVKELVEAGIKQILFITNNRGSVIERYFSSDPWLEDMLIQKGQESYLHGINELISQCSFFYTHQTKPQGIGQAILLAEDFVGNEPFFCHMGDSFFCNSKLGKAMIEHHKKYNSVCTLGVREMSEYALMQKACSVVKDKLEPNVFLLQQVIEKPLKSELKSKLASIGRFVFTPDIFNIIKIRIDNNNLTKQRDFGELMNMLLERGKGLVVKSDSEDILYDAGDLREYYRTLIKYLLVEKKEWIDDLV